MTLSDLHLSKHERFTVKVLLEIRKRLRSEKTEEALQFVEATLDALHQPRLRKGKSTNMKP
jgi:hypothetical protein